MNFNKNHLISFGISVVFLVFINSNIAFSGEHPEHPEGSATKSNTKEHPEHPEKAATASSLTKEELAVAIEEYIKKTSAADKTGFFTVEDEKAEMTLELTLVKVHKERLSQVAPQTYFACADLKEVSGTVYDLDFFMKGPDKDNLTVTEVTVHKEAGKERYTWHEKDGIWKKTSVGSAMKKGSSTHHHHQEGSSTKGHSEHSEHPK